MYYNYLKIFDYLRQDSSENMLNFGKMASKREKSGNGFPLVFF
jgi:hypothetical protein